MNLLDGLSFDIQDLFALFSAIYSHVSYAAWNGKCGRVKNKCNKREREWKKNSISPHFYSESEKTTSRSRRHRLHINAIHVIMLLVDLVRSLLICFDWIGGGKNCAQIERDKKMKNYSDLTFDWFLSLLINKCLRCV